MKTETAQKALDTDITIFFIAREGGAGRKG